MKHKSGLPLRPLAAPDAAAAARGAQRLGSGEFFKNGLGSAASADAPRPRIASGVSRPRPASRPKT